MKVKTKCYVCNSKAYFKYLNIKEAKIIKRDLRENTIYDALGVLCDKCHERTPYKYIGIDWGKED